MREFKAVVQRTTGASFSFFRPRPKTSGGDQHEAPYSLSNSEPAECCSPPLTLPLPHARPLRKAGIPKPFSRACSRSEARLAPEWPPATEGRASCDNGCYELRQLDGASVSKGSISLRQLTAELSLTNDYYNAIRDAIDYSQRRQTTTAV